MLIYSPITSTVARVVALPQPLSQIATLCVEPDDRLLPRTTPALPAAACGREVTGSSPTRVGRHLLALVRLLGRQAAREYFLAPANDDAA